jgi:hypothetical protein
MSKTAIRRLMTEYKGISINLKSRAYSKRSRRNNRRTRKRRQSIPLGRFDRRSLRHTLRRRTIPSLTDFPKRLPAQPTNHEVRDINAPKKLTKTGSNAIFITRMYTQTERCVFRFYTRLVTTRTSTSVVILSFFFIRQLRKDGRRSRAWKRSY